MKNYFFYFSKQQNTHLKVLEEIILVLDTYKSDKIANDLPYRLSVSNAIKEVQNASESLNKSKRMYIQAIHEFNVIQEKINVLQYQIDNVDVMNEEKKDISNNFLMGRVLSAFELTREQEKERLLKKLIKIENDLILYADDMNTKKMNLASKLSVRDMAIEQVIHI